MAIIVRIWDDGKFIYDSAKGVGFSEEDKELAIRLNSVIKNKMEKLIEKFRKSKIVKGNRNRNKAEVYWEFGNVLRKIFFESGLVDASEKKLFWQNVRLHAPEGLLAKDRGPNRIHIAYCFRLAGYPRNLALKREWSEWVYLFDSPFVNSEDRFDAWDKTKLEKEKDYTTRENTRLFIQCLNSILKDIETKDLDDEELLRCYEGSWILSKKLIENSDYSDTENFKIKLRAAISNKKNSIGQLIEGGIQPEEFAKTIITDI